MFKKKSINFYSIAVPVLIFSLAAIMPGCKEQPREEVELEIWGVFDDSDVFKELIGSFNQLHPDTKLKYYKKTYTTYEADLLEAMATGRGPDIFMIHNTWPTRYEDVLVPVSSDLITYKEFKEDFVDVVHADFATADGEIIALPLSVDTLALYYNKDVFNTVGIAQPPKTWSEFLDDVEKIAVRDDRDNILRAAVALGTAQNINRSTDILSLLMLQSGVPITDKNNNALFDRETSSQGGSFSSGERALQFYTDFANPLKSVYTWNARMDYSIDAFYKGEVAMMLSYNYHMPTIQSKAPYLNFDVAPMPQIDGSSLDVNFANYWGLAVSSKCNNPDRAWEFLTWLTGYDGALEYLKLTNKPTARRDLVNWQKTDADVGVFAEQALTAESWVQLDNRKVEQIFADMIESVTLGKSTIEDAVKEGADNINLLSK